METKLRPYWILIPYSRPLNSDLKQISNTPIVPGQENWNIQNFRFRVGEVVEESNTEGWVIYLFVFTVQAIFCDV